MYLLDLKVEQSVYLVARHTEEPWLWHAWFGHLSFDTLGRLEKMVRGLPHIEHGGELCDSCQAGKQRRLSFLKAAKYHSSDALELVHGDLCDRSPQPQMVVGGTSSYTWMIVVATCGCNSR